MLSTDIHCLGFKEGYTKAMYVTKSKTVMFSVSMQDNDKFPSHPIVNLLYRSYILSFKVSATYSCTNV